MMARNHTPGPWSFDQNVVVSVADKHGDWPIICEQYPHSDANWEHDRVLISAAPQMLSAIEKALRALNGLQDKERDKFKELIHVLDGTIKRAKYHKGVGCD